VLTNQHQTRHLRGFTTATCKHLGIAVLKEHNDVSQNENYVLST